MKAKDNQINWLNSSLRLYISKYLFYKMQAYCGKDYNVIPTGMIGSIKHIPIESWEEYKWFDHIEHTPTGIRYDVFIDGQIRNQGGRTYLVTLINKEK